MELIKDSILTNKVILPGYSVVYGFDLDWTLIKNKTNKKFWSTKDETIFWHPSVPKKLKELNEKGIGIVVFTNQLGLTGMKKEIFMNKVKWFLQQFDFPIKVYASINEDAFRKPSKLMWNYFTKHDNTIKLDKFKCMYIGDAAGRKNDFSSSDRKFAVNVSVQFQTPEEFFLGHASQPFTMIGFNPLEYCVPSESVVVKSSTTQELVIMVGSPASGKSTFTQQTFPEYERVNQDTLKTKPRCIKACDIALATGKSVVIDNTNPSKEVRTEYIKIAKRHKVPVRCVYLERSEALIDHLNILRNHLGHRKKIPAIAMRMFRTKFQEPKKEEGFVEIVKIPFIPVFENTTHKKMFMQVY